MTEDVLVVGAGPTGLTMAIELARRDVRVRVVDRSPAPTTETRALGVQPRTLELFERLGIADAAVAGGVPVADFRLFSENTQFLDLNLRDLDTPYPYLLMLPQPDVEELLRGCLADLGVKVERNVALTRLTQTPDEVEVELRHADGATEQARFSWLTGCDGAHSTVRHQLGVGFLGDAFEENFAVAGLRMLWDLPHAVFHSFLNRGRFVTYFPLPPDLHRVAIAYPAGAAPTGEVTLDELQTAVDRCAPKGAQVGEVIAAGRFRINQRKVARHSVGRVFLAGRLEARGGRPRPGSPGAPRHLRRRAVAGRPTVGQGNPTGDAVDTAAQPGGHRPASPRSAARHIPAGRPAHNLACADPARRVLSQRIGRQ